MVYLTIPEDLTKEEKMLKKKYELLRECQKKLKTSTKEPSPIKKVSEKRSLEVKSDAKEVAKKLLKSGAISAIKKESKEKTIFKRSKGSEKKNSGRNSKSRSSYQPFSSSCNSFSTSSPTKFASPDFRSSKSSCISRPFSSPCDSFTADSPSNFASPDLSSPKSNCRYQPLSTVPPANSKSPEFRNRPVKKLYDNFVSSGKLEDEIKQNSDSHYQNRPRNNMVESPHDGNTVYVRGYDLTREHIYSLTREFLQKTFESIGNIMKIYIPENKLCGFVTFHRNEFAHRAIKTINGTILDGIKLKVYFAKRQFHLRYKSEDVVSLSKMNAPINRNVGEVSEHEFVVSSPKMNASISENIGEISEHEFV